MATRLARLAAVAVAALAAAVAAALATPARPAGPAGAPGAAVAAGVRGSLLLSPTDIARVRASIAAEPWAAAAWARVLADARRARTASPSPPDPAGDFSDDGRTGGRCGGGGWWCALYSPGLTDGFAALEAALAWRIGGSRADAVAARRILLAWVTRYDRPAADVGHMVAEPVGPMIKLFMAADLLWPFLASRERTAVSRWAAQWIAVGFRLSDSALDAPWTPPVEAGGRDVVPAPYGNSAFGQRALALWAAALAGPRFLNGALGWNWQHSTAGGRSYGWLDSVDGMLVRGAGGETIEGRTRESVGYGLFGWAELLLIADLARHAGHSRDLLAAATPQGGSLLSIVPFYAPVVAGEAPWPYGAAESFATGDRDQVRGELRAWFETAYTLCSTGAARADPRCAQLGRTLGAGGDTARAAAYDSHFLAWRALLGMPLP